MSRRFSLVISWGCVAIIVLSALMIVGALFNIHMFADLAESYVALPIHWATVELGQWYGLWLLTSLYSLIGLVGLYYLHRAFANMAKGELFNLANSLNIRRFSVLLFAQVVAKPIYIGGMSVLLSLNHPAGEKMLSISFGSQGLVTLGLAMILWVTSDLLITGCRMESENRQFV